MNRLYKSLVFIVLLTCVYILNISCFAHEGPSYKILILNNPSGFMLLNAFVDIEKHLIKIEYLPNSGETKTVIATIAEVLNNFTDIKIINNLEIKTSRLARNEISKAIQYSNTDFKEGKVIVLWVSEEKLSNEKFSLAEKKSILERAKAVLSEQIRLASIGAYHGKDELVDEVGRNMEE